ncbi:acyl carrier protein [Streptomyces shenzhenensis]|uniref:acyl carrier protein n=1 Tax=Streptomyces shenzhenensis TaxID=943815 RepID=UPI0015F07670|nr:acyl carrier protein [Streptomyces shenzhenensis]
MTETDPTPVRHTPEEIRAWLIERVAYYLKQPAEEISPDASLAENGIDSVYAFALCGDIEDALALPVEPTLLWDIDTITALTVHLVALAAE